MACEEKEDLVERTQPSILVIDDQPELREILHDLLTEEGCHVSTRASHDLAEITRLAPDLIILEVVMRDGPSGLEVIQQYRVNPRTAHVPLVICTAAVHLAAQIVPLLAERDHLVLKPFDLDDLLDAVRSGLGHASRSVAA